MLRRFKRPFIVMATVLGILLAGFAGAAVRGGQDFSLNCTGFISNGGRVILNRDNTGQGQEAFTIIATDGNGSVIFGPITETVPVGASIEYPRGLFQTWATVPQANPLFLTISSNEGNGYTAETIYRRTDHCRDLTETGTAGLETLDLSPPLPADAETSPAQPLNAALRTPVSINDLADLYGLSGYGIVNTSRLNMRTGDGVRFARVAILNGGTELVLLGRNEDASWWYVQVDDMRGWVSSEFVILRGDNRRVGLMPADGETIPNRFIYYSDQPLWAAPFESSTQLCTIPGNLEYPIKGRDSNWLWYEIDATCNGAPASGWVRANLGAFRRSDDAGVPVTTDF